MASKARRAEKRLDKPGRKVIRGRAAKLLKKADAAVARLRDPHDAEALHDSRVALRRLRGWLQAFHEELHFKGKQKRELRRLAHSTNQARDAEVGTEWLARHERQRRPQSGADATRFASDLQALREQSYRSVRRDLPSAWRRLSRKLGCAVAAVSPTHHAFRRDFASSLASYAKEFERARADARRKPSPPNIHALRIAGKKLRYLTETALRRASMVQGFLREMNALHDSAGAIQDLQRLQALSEEDLLHRVDGRYRHLLMTGTSHHPALAPDMGPYVRVARTAAREQARRIARFREVYLGHKQPNCLRELHGLMRKLEH